LESQYVRENADGDPLLPYDPYGYGNYADGGWWGSGGGVSTLYKKPAYQKLVKTGSPWRTNPDVSLHMGGCPVGSIEPCSPERSSVITVVDGEGWLVIGTSVSAPEFAGLLALEIEHLGGRLGNENYDIYSMAAQQAAGAAQHDVFRTNIPGFDGIYSTRPGYDYVVGNGTVYGKYFIHAPSVPSAGDPGTPSNP
jgi:subtilase family serine protease